MATYKQTDAVQGGRCEVPQQLYRVRCIGTKSGKSSSGNPMITIKNEIIDPESIDINGEPFRIAGRQFMMFLMLTGDLLPGQMQSGLSQTFEFLEKLGISHGGELDDSLHRELFLGQEWDMVLSSYEDVKRLAPKPGQKVGDPILDGEGNKISAGWFIKANLSDVPAHCRPSKNEQVAAQLY